MAFSWHADFECITSVFLHFNITVSAKLIQVNICVKASSSVINVIKHMMQNVSFTQLT